MNISERWLREWANPSVDTDTLVAQLTMAGLEVDGVEPAAPALDYVVVAEVKSMEKHPDADKLNVCQVDAGTGELLQIVCGASNVRQGLKIPCAMIGAKFGDFKIKKAKLRGVESNGMLCSAEEIGLAESAEGLYELPADAPVGTSITEYIGLDDNIIEVDLTPNRADCLSVVGIAREVGVLNRCNLTPVEIDAVAASHEQTFPVKLTASADCPRYVSRVITGVNAKAETPIWMQEKLRRGGIRSLGPIIDVTNFVLLELGQPMHAFDKAQLSGSIEVRRGIKGEVLTLLDGAEAKLDEEVLIIADDNGPLALAGVMGGEKSGCNDDTADVVLESAFFQPVSIAGKARRFGLHTDSSHRFERGVDFASQTKAIERATQLLLEICGGEAGPVAEYKTDADLPVVATITLRQARLDKVLGTKIPASDVTEILTRLGMKVSVEEGQWVATAPSFRFDMEIEADLIEEVARIYGYHKLGENRVGAARAIEAKPEAKRDIDVLRDQLVTRDYQEAITYSFVEPSFQQSIEPEHQGVDLANALSAELAQMRTSLWPGLLKAVSYNVNRQQARVRMFETGLRFRQTSGSEMSQERVLSGVITGPVTNANWQQEARNADFYDLKGDLEAVLGGVKGNITFSAGEHPALHPGQCATIQLDGKQIGHIGTLHPQQQADLDVANEVILFEILVDSLLNITVPSFVEVPKYPSIRRDLSFVVTDSVPGATICEAVRTVAGKQLVDVTIFDVYRGKGIESGMKSVALGLVLQDSSATLTDEQIDAVVNDVVASLISKFQITIRE